MSSVCPVFNIEDFIFTSVSRCRLELFVSWAFRKISRVNIKIIFFIVFRSLIARVYFSARTMGCFAKSNYSSNEYVVLKNQLKFVCIQDWRFKINGQFNAVKDFFKKRCHFIKNNSPDSFFINTFNKLLLTSHASMQKSYIKSQINGYCRSLALQIFLFLTRLRTSII